MKLATRAPGRSHGHGSAGETALGPSGDHRRGLECGRADPRLSNRASPRGERRARARTGRDLSRHRRAGRDRAAPHARPDRRHRPVRPGGQRVRPRRRRRCARPLGPRVVRDRGARADLLCLAVRAATVDVLLRPLVRDAGRSGSDAHLRPAVGESALPRGEPPHHPGVGGGVQRRVRAARRDGAHAADRRRARRRPVGSPSPRSPGRSRTRAGCAPATPRNRRRCAGRAPAGAPRSRSRSSRSPRPARRP